VTDALGDAAKCSVCGRAAVYKRTYSGEILCERCLLRALARSVKRQASRYGRTFRARMSVLVAASLHSPHLGAALALALSRATANLGVAVNMAIPQGDGWGVEFDPESLETLRARGVRIWRAHLRLEGGLPSTLVGCMRLDRAWSARAARLIGAHAVAVPVTRTLAILAALDSLLAGEPWGLSEASQEASSVSGLAVAPLFYGVEGEAAAALAGAWRLHAWPACRPSTLGKRAFYSIARGRPELEFSVHKTVEPLAASARRRYGVCPQCGGLTPGGGLCPHCRRSRIVCVGVEPA